MAKNESAMAKEIKENLEKRGGHFILFFFKKGIRKRIKYVELLKGKSVVVIPKKKKMPLSLKDVVEFQHL